MSCVSENESLDKEAQTLDEDDENYAIDSDGPSDDENYDKGRQVTTMSGSIFYNLFEFNFCIQEWITKQIEK